MGSKCQPGYTEYGGNCFIAQKLDDGQKSWSQAQEKCKGLGDRYGDIATVVDVFENAELRLLLNEAAHKAGVQHGGFSAWFGMLGNVSAKK